MTRARTPRPQEIDAARRDERLLRALQEGGRDPAWRTRGVCQTVDPETFFPAPSEPADAAVALCRSCPVQGSCLAWALQAGDLHGVWGGTTARERRAMSVVWHSALPQPSGSGHAPETGPHDAPAPGVRHVPTPEPAPAASAASVPEATRAAAPVPASRPPAEPAPLGTDRIGPAMDRDELLRLVRAG